MARVCASVPLCHGPDDRRQALAKLSVGFANQDAAGQIAANRPEPVGHFETHGGRELGRQQSLVNCQEQRTARIVHGLRVRRASPLG